MTMTSQVIMSRKDSRALLGLLLTMPLTTPLTVGILYEIFHWEYPVYLLGSVLEDLGFEYLPPWVAITVLLVGPVLAFYLNANVFSRMRFETTKEKCDCWVSFRRNWMNLAVLFLSFISTLILVTLLLIIL